MRSGRKINHDHFHLFITPLALFQFRIQIKSASFWKSWETKSCSYREVERRSSAGGKSSSEQTSTGWKREQEPGPGVGPREGERNAGRGVNWISEVSFAEDLPCERRHSAPRPFFLLFFCLFFSFVDFLCSRLLCQLIKVIRYKTSCRVDIQNGPRAWHILFPISVLGQLSEQRGKKKCSEPQNKPAAFLFFPLYAFKI